MERNYSKVPSWEFAELEQNAELNMGSFLGSSGGRDCSVDLKLGGLGDFRPAEEWKSRPMVSTTRVASSGPSKRARAPGSAGQMASCSVDGCRSDLSNSREYHRRHKVCEVHSKTPFVMVGGQEQRFCQQCSRFHLLVEFDEVKRSCRKRLDGHNRRRRKPQPESVFNPGSLFANHQGSRFSAHPRVLPTPIQALNQAVIIQTEDKLYTNNLPLLVADNQHHSLGSFLSYENRKQFPFLQYDTTAFSIATMGQSTCQPLKHISSAESSSKILSDGIAQVHSDCALSLLSSSTQDPGIGMGQMLSAGRIPMHQSLVSSLPYNNNLGLRSSSQASSYVMPTGFSFSGIEDEEVGAVFVGDDDTNLHCQSVFHVGEGSSDGVSQPLPFFWQ